MGVNIYIYPSYYFRARDSTDSLGRLLETTMTNTTATTRTASTSLYSSTPLEQFVVGFGYLAVVAKQCSVSSPWPLFGMTLVGGAVYKIVRPGGVRPGAS